jgi:dTDP-4-amino-4,6-dideoxygalactose transaminase
MLNKLIPYVLAMRGRWPRAYQFFVNIGKRYFAKRLGIFPRPLANEIGAVTAVLKSGQWNMAYGAGLEHERLESDFAEFLGGGHAIAVNTGGMAIQMALRGLGLRPGDEIIHQIDTCSATAMAVMNAGCTPIFADIADETLMLNFQGVRDAIGPGTKALIATHMWGNPENIDAALNLKKDKGLILLEDGCLALGANYKHRPVGSYGDASVFSFGCLKPIQGGEGGMIFTHNEALARELRAMRHWGDRTIEFGVRDALQLSWNGRMSEIIAAVIRQQLKGYPAHLMHLREAVMEFDAYLKNIEGWTLVYGACDDPRNSAFTQVVLRIDESRTGLTKLAIMEQLYRGGIQVRHANFELINSLSFIKNGNWREWLPRADMPRVASNYAAQYPQAQRVFDSDGIGLGCVNFLSKGNFKHLKQQIELLIARRS